MPTFRRRPSFIDAVQFTDTSNPPRGVEVDHTGRHYVTSHQRQKVFVALTEWIAAEPSGQGYYPISDELFSKLYEPIKEDA